MNWNKTLVLAILFLIGLPCFAQPATIYDLWFMRGKWLADLGDKSFVREEWTREDDKTLTGSCLFMEDSAPATSEAMRVTETKDGMILTIKHTKKDGTPWNDEDEAGNLRLVEYDLTHAVFDNGNEKNRVRITYTWKEDLKLFTEVEVTKDEKQKRFSFDYIREDPESTAPYWTSFTEPYFTFDDKKELPEPFKFPWEDKSGYGSNGWYLPKDVRARYSVYDLIADPP